MDSTDERWRGDHLLRPAPELPPQRAAPAIGRGMRRWLAAIVLCVGQLMIVLDATAVNVALPSIQRSLHFSQADLAWVVNAYLIAFAGFLLLAGRAGDLVGRKKVFLTGLVVFTVASLVCGVSQTQEMLVGARFVQGVGGAISSSVILGILVAGVSSAGERAKMIGLYTLVASTGGSLGLLLGGAMTQAVGWHWIFFINIPIGVLALIVAALLVNENAGIGLRNGVDVLGAVLVTGSLMLAVYAIVESAYDGWESPRTIATAAAAIAVFAAFIALEARLRHPLIPLAALRSRDLSSANLVRMLLICAVTGQFFIGVLYMQHLLGYSPLDTGLAFLPLTIVLGPFALVITSRLVTRIGPKATMLPGLLLVLAGLLVFAQAPLHAQYVRDLLPALILLGLGQGLAFLPTVTLAMSGATSDDAGLRSGLVNVSQQMGGALGVAVLASVSTSRTDRLLADGGTHGTALLAGYHLAYVVAAVIVAAAMIAAITLIRSRPLPVTTAAHDAPEPAAATSQHRA
jgi:EmrB/QacA subfamily drug resistance transporter